MEYLSFSEENLDEYELKATLLDHSKISDSNRAVNFESTQRLFTWLSEECSRQKISRYSFALTCSYIDLYFMKKNDIDLKNYQILALGALVLATKQVQIEGRVPIIDLGLFKLNELLDMEKKIVLSLNYYLNPPIYTELINNIAKLWDMKCQSGQIGSKVRYFNENKECFLRLKVLYEKMDCLNLFKKILNFEIHDVVVTLFYLQTKIFHGELKSSSNPELPKANESLQNPEDVKNFDEIFADFLFMAQIKIKQKQAISKIICLLTKDKFPINEDGPNLGSTFTQFLSYQTHNKFGLQFYKKYQAQINKL